MKNTLLLAVTIFGFISQAQAAFKTSESAIYAYGKTSKYEVIIANTSNGKYQVTRTSDGYTFPDLVDESSLDKVKGCGKTTPRFCVNEDVIFAYGKSSKYESKIIGYNNSLNTYTIKRNSDGYIFSDLVVVEQIDKIKGCGQTTPRLCVNDDVIFNYGSSKYEAKIAGYNNVSKTYSVRRNSDAYLFVDKVSVSLLFKLKKSSQFTCDNVDGIISDSTEDIIAAYSGLGSLTTSEKSEYLKTVSKYLLTTNRADTNIFARFTFGKLVKMSTAKMVQDAFGKAVADDQAALLKDGWKSIDQIEANVYTLDFAMRVLQAGIKLRMTMPNANASIQAYLTRLAAIAGEQQLSKKIIGLSALVQDLQPLLQELIQDPRQQSLGMLTADVAGWISKN